MKNKNFSLTIVVLVGAALLLAGCSQSIQGKAVGQGTKTGAWGECSEEVAYFKFRDDWNDYFVFKLIDKEKIQKARNILSGKQRGIPTGIITKGPAPYNPKWGFNYVPSSIDFTEYAMELCDASIHYIEENFEEFCKNFPEDKCRWCPWGARLVAELRDPNCPLNTKMTKKIKQTLE
jgi:hypothetical protein